MQRRWRARLATEVCAASNAEHPMHPMQRRHGQRREGVHPHLPCCARKCPEARPQRRGAPRPIGMASCVPCGEHGHEEDLTVCSCSAGCILSAAVWSPPRGTHRGVPCPGAWVILVFRLRKLTFAANKELYIHQLQTPFPATARCDRATCAVPPVPKEVRRIAYLLASGGAYSTRRSLYARAPRPAPTRCRAVVSDGRDVLDAVSDGGQSRCG